MLALSTAALAVLAQAGPDPFVTPGLAGLPARTDRQTLSFSSADPTGGNVDYGHFLAADGDRRVLAEANGPGRIHRIWSARPQGRLRIEIDDGVAWDGEFAALLAGETPPFVPPLAGPLGGGHACHVPMPFLRRCRITGDAGDYYYQIGISLGAEREAFALPPGPSLARELAALTAGPPQRDGGRVDVARRVRPFAPRVVVVLAGPGEVRELRVLPRRLPADCWRAVWLEARADGEPEPCLAGPLGDVLGVGFDGAGIDCDAVGAVGAARVLRLPMPFRERLELRLVPVAGGPAAAMELDVETTWVPEAIGDRRYLHGAFRRATTRWGEPFRVARIAGAGHFVGGLFTLAGATGQGLTFLEGDERITVDGRDPLVGTGTEDYFTGAWYFRSGPFRWPFGGVAVLDPRRGLCAVARFHVPDPIPFAAELAFDLEHGGRNDTPGADYAAMVFWYADSPAGRPTSAAERASASLPQGTASAAELEAEDLWPEWRELDANASAGAVARLPAGEPTARVEAAAERLIGRTVLVTARPALPPFLVPRLGARLVLPRVAANTRLDAVLIEPYLDSIRAWRVVGPFPARDRHGIDEPRGPDRDDAPDAIYRIGDREVGWRWTALPGRADGYVDLDALFGGVDSAVVYAATTVVSPREQSAVLVLGSDDAIAVRWNGVEVHRSQVLRGSGRDQDHVPLRIREGANRLLLAVEDFAGGFGFHARIEGAADLRFDPGAPR